MWAEHEFGRAPLSDVRLGKRLVKIVHKQAQAPTKSFPGAAQNDQAAVRGYYRLIDQAADSQVSPENILAPHRQRTLQRMRGQAVLLCIQDGTDLNFAQHAGCVGLGLIGKNKGSAGTLGLHMHSTLVVNGEGVPLGLPQIQYEAPDGQAQRRKPQRWIRGLRECAELAGRLEGVRPVSVMDREGDVFALFAEQRRLRRWTCWCGRSTTVRWGRTSRSCSTRSGGRRRRDGCSCTWRDCRGGGRAAGRRAARCARSGWRRWEVELADPDRQAAAQQLRLVHVREETQPEGAERLEWFLLTTLAVETQAEAERVLKWYKLRWRIEDWHRVLKSGCKVEYLGHRQGERIERAVTINAVIAWRLTLMTLLGRDTPELPADCLFTEIELAALEDFAQDRRPPPPANLGRADAGDAGRISELQAQAVRSAGAQGDVGGIHEAGHDHTGGGTDPTAKRG